MRLEAAREGPGFDRISHDCLPVCRNRKPSDTFSVTNSHRESIIVMREMLVLNVYTVAASVFDLTAVLRLD